MEIRNKVSSSGLLSHSDLGTHIFLVKACIRTAYILPSVFILLSILQINFRTTWSVMKITPLGCCFVSTLVALFMDVFPFAYGLTSSETLPSRSSLVIAGRTQYLTDKSVPPFDALTAKRFDCGDGKSKMCCLNRGNDETREGFLWCGYCE